MHADRWIRAVTDARRALAAVAALGMAWSASHSFGQPPGEARRKTPPTQEVTVASLFNDFLHFSILGRFDMAQTYAQELLGRSDLDPVQLLKLSEQQPRSVETLIVLVNNSSISESASKVLDVIHQGEHLLRQDTAQIVADIEKLGGPPQMEHNATKRLADSGEYAIPWILQALGDEAKKNLRPRIIRALPQLGQSAVGPMVQALSLTDERLRQTLVYALGELGYGQAAPYLLALATDPAAAPETKTAAVTAVARIEQRSSLAIPSTPAEAFVALAEQFYDEHGSVRSDPRIKEANVWYWDSGASFVSRIAVPREIFGAVMAMRCCERALLANADDTEALALWLAANIRREARLGLDIGSGDPTESGDLTDPTRPSNFPRALYFTSAAGPRYAHLALQRAVAGRDAPVALGAIAALHRVAGPSSLITADSARSPLVDALSFPDGVVRIRAALALAHGVPRSSFTGADRVVPVLASALSQTGRRQLLVIDPDQENLNRLMNALRTPDATVIGDANPLKGLERARTELVTLSGIVVSSSVTQPDLKETLALLRAPYELSTLPIVVLTVPQDLAPVEQLADKDPGVAVTAANADGPAVAAKFAEAAKRVGQTPLTPELALELGLASARAIKFIALEGIAAYDAAAATPQLVAALGTTPHEELQVELLGALALLKREDAQRAIADTACDDAHAESLRVEAFGGMGESARRHGNLLDGPRVDRLQKIAADEPDLTLRTAASQALGALNLTPEKAGRIALKYRRE